MTDSTQNEMLEIYKLHAELADRVSQRREGANRLYVSLLVGLELLTADGWRALREVGDCAATTVCCTLAGVRPRPLRVRESTGLRRGISIVQRANERESTNAGP